jgi:hypothetical protein
MLSETEREALKKWPPRSSMAPPQTAALQASSPTDTNNDTTTVAFIRVVLSDVLGGKDVVEERDRRTDGRVG